MAFFTPFKSQIYTTSQWCWILCLCMIRPSGSMYTQNNRGAKDGTLDNTRGQRCHRSGGNTDHDWKSSVWRVKMAVHQVLSAFRPRLRAVTFSSGYNLKIIFSKIKCVSVIQNRSSSLLLYLFIFYVIILTKLLILSCDFLVTIINLIYDMILLNGFSLLRDFF